MDIIEDMVEFFFVSGGRCWWGVVVESGRHDGMSSEERILILLDWF